MSDSDSGFEGIRKEIERILPESPLDFELKHARLVLKWVMKLEPSADEALRIAALSHDIDRAVNKITEKDLKDYSKINEFKKEHSIRSAEIICGILETRRYPAETVEKVKRLVENHEFGGDRESDILMEADSLAYFENNIPSYLKRNGLERTKAKIRFMYDRLSDKAKGLVRQMKFDDREIGDLFRQSIG
jgi:hypothetical protein